MRPVVLLLCAGLLLSIALGQSDRGTITGTVADPTGAVVASAAIQAKNADTGAVYTAASTTTGNYTLSQLPTGTYELTVTVTGFKRYVRPGLVLPVAQTVRVDVTLEVGATNESVTVTETSPLLKTESGELSHNVSTDRLDNLPVLGIGAGGGISGLRNPYSVMQLLPGSDYRPDSSIRLNGLPSNTQSMRIEGQDSTNELINQQYMTQPSVDAIQELAIQTSNYAAEFGQAGGGVFNATMKSGTNVFHGSGYEYFVNEAFNAGQAFTDAGVSDGRKAGQHIRNRQRRNDYGFTVGGPIEIPKLYDGHNKTFFFFSFEQFRETAINSTTTITVPTEAYRIGDFRQALTGKPLCPTTNPNCDPLGRPIFENTIYDPSNTFDVNGQRTRNPFPNNTVPIAQQDKVALNIIALIPHPQTAGKTLNYSVPFTNPRTSDIPSLKLDHSLSDKIKVSGYWSRTGTSAPNNNTLSQPITSAVPSDIVTHTVRLNYDQTLTPTMLLHLGAGLIHLQNNQPLPDYDPVAGIGLKGTYAQLFPTIQGLTQAQGGLSTNLGPGAQVFLLNTKPTANASLTWVKNNHTYKFGGEMVIVGYPAFNQTYANAWISFTNNANCNGCAPVSSLPSIVGQSLSGGFPGFPFASFMLGGADNGFIAVPSKSRMGAKSLSGFVQDSWKITSKLTLDYGLRYDFQTYLKEQHGRIPYFSAVTPNPSAGGKLGAVAFEGNAPGHCNCDLAHNYPYAFGPRIGLAYQMLPKTVLRIGGGISYFKTAQNGFNSYSTGSQNIYNSPTFGDPAYWLRDGVPYKITWPNLDPGQVPLPGTIASPSQQIDPQAGRPARTIQWSFGIQREVSKDMVVDVTYVGNRGAWWNSAYLSCLNCLTADALAARGLSLNSADDLKLLGSPINSALAIQRGFGAPYSGFPSSALVSQSLRPFPQFGGITNMHWAPLGDSWYDSLQASATKRFSHGLDFTSSFTWSKTFMRGTEADISTISPTTPPTNDVFNLPQNKYLSGLDQPFLLVFAGNYTTPKTTNNKWVSQVVRDWQLGAVFRYSSGLPIMSPIANNGLRDLLYRGTGAVGTTGGTFMNRVSGQPFFTTDLNCHCFDPSKAFVLNPNAWAPPAAGQWGTAAAYYGDYRYQRRPSESMSLGRNFRIGSEGKYNLQIRAEFSNIFNRLEMSNPTSTNSQASQTCADVTGKSVSCASSFFKTTAGFGFINTTTVAAQPRQGTLVARFTF
jgi:Carboxypeptidase regulatory-like domain/TonB dependent receptor